MNWIVKGDQAFKLKILTRVSSMYSLLFDDFINVVWVKARKVHFIKNIHSK